MSNCSRICITAAEYDPAIHTIIGAYTTEEECLAACNCVDPSADWGGLANWSTNIAWTGIAYGANKFVAVSLNDPDDFDNLAYSTDGKTWTFGKLPNTTGSGIKYDGFAFGNNTFVGYSEGVGGTVFRSEDGINWTTVSVEIDSLDKLAFVNDRFIALRTSNAYTSADGITWTTITIGPNSSTIWDAAVYAAGQIVAFGGNAGSQNVYTAKSSNNGVNWTVTETDNTNTNFILQTRNFVHGAGKFMTTYLESNGSGYDTWFATSTDAITWTKLSRPNELTNPISDTIVALGYNNEKFYAFLTVLGGGDPSALTIRAVSSVDGVNWVENTVSDAPAGTEPTETAAAPNGQIVGICNPPLLNPPPNA